MSNTYDYDYRSYGSHGYPSVGGAASGYSQPAVGGAADMGYYGQQAVGGAADMGYYGQQGVGGAGMGYGQPAVGGVNAAMYSHGGMMIPGTAFMQQMPPNVPSGAVITPNATTITAPIREESYVENILRLNRSKMATFYMTYENNKEWNAKIFRGVIEAAGRDHIIIRDPATNMRYLLLTLNLDYVTFDGPIAYEYQFQGQTISNLSPETDR